MANLRTVVADPAAGGTTTGGIQEALTDLRDAGGANQRAGTVLVQMPVGAASLLCTAPVVVDGWKGLKIAAFSGGAGDAVASNGKSIEFANAIDGFVITASDGVTFENLDVRGPIQGDPNNPVPSTFMDAAFRLKGAAGLIVRKIIFKECSVRYADTAFSFETVDTPDDQVDDVRLDNTEVTDCNRSIRQEVKQLVNLVITGGSLRGYQEVCNFVAGFCDMSAVGLLLQDNAATAEALVNAIFVIAQDYRDLNVSMCRAEIKRGDWAHTIGNQDRWLRTFSMCHPFLQDHDGYLVKNLDAGVSTGHSRLSFDKSTFLQRDGQWNRNFWPIVDALSMIVDTDDVDI